MMGRDFGHPPSDWPGLEMTGMTRLTDRIYYGWLPDDRTPTFWHWCSALDEALPEYLLDGQWVAAGTSLHTVVTRDPLHMEPSLLWRCCGIHGWVRHGMWVDA